MSSVDSSVIDAPILELRRFSEWKVKTTCHGKDLLSRLKRTRFFQRFISHVQSNVRLPFTSFFPTVFSISDGEED